MKADKDSFLDLKKREGQYILVNVSTGKTKSWSIGERIFIKLNDS